MKSLVIFALPLLANAAVTGSRLDARQLDLLGAVGMGGGVQAPISRKTLQSEQDPKAKREVLIWGPFKLNPSNGTHPSGGLKLDPNSDVFGAQLSGVCTDCEVLAGAAEIVHKDGKKTEVGDGIYGHHTIMIDMGRKMVMMPVIPQCPNGTKGGFSFGSTGGAAMGGMSHDMGVAAAAPAAPAAPAASAAPATSSSAAAVAGHSHGSKRQAPAAPSAAPSGLAGLAGLASGIASGLSGLGSALGNIGKAIEATPGVSVFIGKGGEGSTTLFYTKGSEVKSGFYIGPKDTMMFTSEVVNYDKFEKDVYISLDYEYLQGQQPGFLDVGMGAINVEGCGSMAFRPPADKLVTFTSNPWAVIANGYLINVSPHLHDGALDIKLFLNGKHVCTSEAVYGSANGAADIGGQTWETITSYKPCLKPIQIKVGDVLTMTSDYDLTKHRLRPDAVNHEMGAEAMALTNFQFAQSK